MSTTTRTPWTPGPWRVGGSYRTTDVVAGHNAIVARVTGDGMPDANAQLIALAPEMADSLTDAEAAIGENLVWITDCADLLVRQKDPEALRRLKQLEDAWTALAKIASRIPKGE